MKKIPLKYYIFGTVAIVGLGYWSYVIVRNKKTYEAIKKAISTGGTASQGTGATGTVLDWKNDPVFGSTMIPSGTTSDTKGLPLGDYTLNQAVKDIYNSMNTTSLLNLFNNSDNVVAVVKKYAHSQQQFSQISARFFTTYKQTLYDFFATNSDTIKGVTDYLKTIPKYQTSN